MPGVKVQTTTATGPATSAAAVTGQWFVSGLAERGDTSKPILLRGMADYNGFLGNRVAYGSLYDAIKCFFDEGGTQCYVRRVVGSAATTGTLVLKDQGQTAENTLTVDAASAGDWSSQLSVEIDVGSVADTFQMIVYLNGEPVESYDNLDSPATAAAKFKNSIYVVVTDMGSSTPVPANNPVAIAATPLSAGADDRTHVASTDLVSALDTFVPELGTGAVSIPGQGVTVHSGVIAHCEANNRIALLAHSQDATQSDLITAALAQTSEYAGLIAPWVIVSDGAGGTRAIGPEGFAAGKRAQAHQRVGAWQIPAGTYGIANSVLDLEATFSASSANTMDAAGVSVIRNINNSIRLYGWRSLSRDTANYEFLSVRDLLDALVVDCTAALEDYVFMPIDSKGQLLARINAALVGVVDPIASAGGLYGLDDSSGKQVDPGYKVDTGSNVNTPSTLATNTVNALVSVRPSPSAADIVLLITKSGFSSGL